MANLTDDITRIFGLTEKEIKPFKKLNGAELTLLFEELKEWIENNGLLLTSPQDPRIRKHLLFLCSTWKTHVFSFNKFIKKTIITA